MSQVVPSTDLTAFTCPHCGALAAHTWYELHGSKISREPRHPFVPRGTDLDFTGIVSEEDLIAAKKWARQMVKGEIFFADEPRGIIVSQINNVYLSVCFNCELSSLWHSRNLVFPRHRAGIAPNKDLDEDIKNDIEEARSILDASPRGAAALLRLAVQKLCKQLGEDGKNIDHDIQRLVDKGMDPHLQQAFDAVRVIGNEAVHPGELDLTDDRETAITLIDLINIVAQEMISNKKAIAALYATLPKGKIDGIKARLKSAEAKRGIEKS